MRRTYGRDTLVNRKKRVHLEWVRTRERRKRNVKWSFLLLVFFSTLCAKRLLSKLIQIDSSAFRNCKYNWWLKSKRMDGSINQAMHAYKVNHINPPLPRSWHALGTCLIRYERTNPRSKSKKQINKEVLFRFSSIDFIRLLDTKQARIATRGILDILPIFDRRFFISFNVWHDWANDKIFWILKGKEDYLFHAWINLPYSNQIIC